MQNSEFNLKSYVTSALLQNVCIVLNTKPILPICQLMKSFFFWSPLLFENLFQPLIRPENFLFNYFSECLWFVNLRLIFDVFKLMAQKGHLILCYDTSVNAVEYGAASCSTNL